MIAFLLTACAGPRVAPEPDRVGTWVVYWDAERGLDELDSYGALFDYASLFAYELAPDGRPRPAPGMESARDRFQSLARQHDIQAWATVVNDVRHPDGSVDLKSAEVVHAVISNPQRRARHARELAQRIGDDGFDGLHLDYEQVHERHRAGFRAFVGLLADELARRGLGLDVILEPSRGPRPAAGTARVTVMAYNLHGPHSGPGPRATPAFARDVAPDMDLDRYAAPSVALALAGFVWGGDGSVKAIDWRAAREAVGDGTTQRGASHKVPYARIADGEIWYEDAESLDAKWRAAHEGGFRGLALWRLGGNDERLFNWLETLNRDNRTTEPPEQ
ncbi:MAG TPA: hypothetical protein VK973_11505 [Arenicellales bacterium]|nr:hypothetical protein [Arenicellales bacterium]